MVGEAAGGVFTVLTAVPRVLNQLDRMPSSRTYGCFDRDYWHYKIVDFPCARKQEATLLLALLVSSKMAGNDYHGNAAMREWAFAGIRYWASIQGRDGSFSEWYPNEHSFVATAFSLYAVTEALILLGVQPSGDLRVSIGKAADFLERMKESRVQNQECGAVIALHNASLLLNETRYASCAKDRLARLEDLQSPEGWFREYGGPDIGYLSLAVDYIGKYYDKTGSEVAGRIVERAVAFMRWFAHPDGSCGGVYSSRNTEYLIPSAFEHLRSQDCAAMADFCRKGMASGSLPHCGTLTDRYLLYNGYTHAQAILAQGSDPGQLNFDTPFTRMFPECGLRIINNANYFLITNERKGGAFFFLGKKSGRVVQDSGLFVRTDHGWLHSSFLGSSSEIRGDSILVRGRLQQLPAQTMSPARYMALRSALFLTGSSGSLSRLLKERLRDMVVTPRAVAGASFTRILTIGPGAVTVADEVMGIARARMVLGVKQPAQYVPSANLFTPHDMASPGVTVEGLSAKRVLD